MHPNPVNSFGEWLQTRRHQLGLSQKRLAARVNYSVIAIRKLEAGDRRCSEELAQLLIAALEIPVQHAAAFMVSARTGILESSLNAQLSPDVHAAESSSLQPAWAYFATPRASIFGRETEIQHVLMLLQQPHIQLITLPGAPGVGKTRLALEVLNQANVSDWPDGKFFVPLTYINHAGLIPEAIAAAMCIRDVKVGRWRDTLASQSVFRFVQHKRVLLVLDNFEHLIDGVPFISELLAAAPMIKVVVTSRGNLNLSSEQEYPVQPLPVPPVPSRLNMTGAVLQQAAQNSAVGLFTARAQSRRPSFKLGMDNVADVIELCQMLNGLPLALELAAYQMKMQTPQELLVQLKAAPPALPMAESGQGINITRRNALRWLNKATRDMPLRHQTLEAAINWSYNLLAPEAQRMFAQLAVFHGGFTREMALAVTQGSPESLEALMSQSLVQVQTLPDNQLRLNLLEVFREFAWVKLAELGESGPAHCRHAQYFTAVSARAEIGLRGPEHLDWLLLLEIETPNIRVALDWCLQHDLATGFLIARQMIQYWFLGNSHYEGRAWIQQLLAASEQTAEVFAEARAYVVCLAVDLNLGTPVTELERHIAVLQGAGDALGVALAQTYLSLALMGSQPHRAEQYATQAVATLDALGEIWHSTRARVFLAASLYAQARFVDSETVLQENIRLLTQIQDLRGLARIQNHLGWAAFAQGHYETALAVERDAVLMNQHFKDMTGLLEALSNLASITIELGQLDQARIYIDQGLKMMAETGIDRYQPHLMRAAGLLAWAQGNPGDACACHIQSLALAQQHQRTDHIRKSLVNLAQIAIDMAQMAQVEAADVVLWLSAVQADAARAHFFFTRSYRVRMRQVIAAALVRLPRAVFDSAMAGGSALTLDEAVRLAQAAAASIIDHARHGDASQSNVIPFVIPLSLAAQST